MMGSTTFGFSLVLPFRPRHRFQAAQHFHCQHQPEPCRQGDQAPEQFRDILSAVSRRQWLQYRGIRHLSACLLPGDALDDPYSH